MPKGESNRKLSDADRHEIVRRYTTPLPDGTWEPVAQLAAEWKVARPTIYRLLRITGAQVRDVNDAYISGKRCKGIKHPNQLGVPPLCGCGCGCGVAWARSKYRWNKYVRGHYRKNALYKSSEWLQANYIVLRRSVDDIAAEFGVNVTSIIHAMEQHGIERRNASDSKIGRFEGSKNPAWKGGVTPERQRLYKQGRWSDFVKHVYRRDDYTCQRCKGPGKGWRKLHAHHVKSWADHPELRFDISNLITLCRECHLWVHSKANTSNEYLEQ